MSGSGPGTLRRAPGGVVHTSEPLQEERRSARRNPLHTVVETEETDDAVEAVRPSSIHDSRRLRADAYHEPDSPFAPSEEEERPSVLRVVGESLVDFFLL